MQSRDEDIWTIKILAKGGFEDREGEEMLRPMICRKLINQVVCTTGRKNDMWKMKFRALALFLGLTLAFTACAQTQEEKSEESLAQENSEGQEESSTQEEAGTQEESVAESEEADSEPTWTSDETQEVTIMMEVSALPGEDDLVIAELEKRTGVKINMISVLSGTDYSTKLNAMIAAGNVPDVFYTNISSIQEYKEAGLLANVEDVLTAVAPNVVEDTKDVIYQVACNKEGEVYMVPSMIKGYAPNLNIRKDWLDNLGMDMPTDLESYREVLNAFTYNDPDGNGKDDTIGVEFSMAHLPTMAWTSVFGAYGIAAGKNIELEDGTVTTWVKHPRFIEAMTYIQDIIGDGVCEPDYISMPSVNSIEKFWSGVAGVFEWNSVGSTNNWYPSRYAEDPAPTLEFAILEGPYGDSGVPAVYPNLTAGWVFSATCKNMEGAAKIANYCMSEEGADLLYFGIEDVMYRWIDREKGEYEYLGEYADAATHRTAGGYCYWALFAPSDNTEYRTLNAQTREGVQLAYANGIDWVNIPYTSEVWNKYGADMSQVINEMLAELFTTEGDLQEVYDRYMEEWETVGGTEWEEEVTAQWKELKESR